VRLEITRNTNKILVLLLPSLRISGGVLEALRLGTALAKRGVDVRVLALWKHPHEVDSMGLPVDHLSAFSPRKSRALWQVFLLMGRYIRYTSRTRGRNVRAVSLLLTHYSTVPFAWLTPSLERWFFIQDLEWKFLSQAFVRWFLRSGILFTARRSRVITANDFLSLKLEELGIAPFAQTSIWAAPHWLTQNVSSHRPIDIVLMLRHAPVKRLDMYVQLIRELRQQTSLTLAIITPEPALYKQFAEQADHALLRPSVDESRDLYLRSKIFVLLSDTEGFGLPPLEAMGSGCIPLCRDSGGVRSYMRDDLAENLVPVTESVAMIALRLKHLLSDGDKLGALSIAARTCFAEGLRVSQSESDSAFGHIAVTLLGLSPSER